MASKEESNNETTYKAKNKTKEQVSIQANCEDLPIHDTNNVSHLPTKSNSNLQKLSNILEEVIEANTVEKRNQLQRQNKIIKTINNFMSDQLAEFKPLAEQFENSKPISSDLGNQYNSLISNQHLYLKKIKKAKNNEDLLRKLTLYFESMDKILAEVSNLDEIQSLIVKQGRIIESIEKNCDEYFVEKIVAHYLSCKNMLKRVIKANELEIQKLNEANELEIQKLNEVNELEIQKLNEAHRLEIQKLNETNQLESQKLNDANEILEYRENEHLRVIRLLSICTLALISTSAYLIYTVYFHG